MERLPAFLVSGCQPEECLCPASTACCEGPSCSASAGGTIAVDLWSASSPLVTQSHLMHSVSMPRCVTRLRFIAVAAALSLLATGAEAQTEGRSVEAGRRKLDAHLQRELDRDGDS